MISLKINWKIHSSYLQKPGVSLHCAVLYRHHLPDIDGHTHDHVGESDFSKSSVLIPLMTIPLHMKPCNYPTSLTYQTAMSHEFTNSYASQYKSRPLLWGFELVDTGSWVQNDPQRI